MTKSEILISKNKQEFRAVILFYVIFSLPVSLPGDQTDSYALGSGHCTSNCVVTSAPSPGPTGTL